MRLPWGFVAILPLLRYKLNSITMTSTDVFAVVKMHLLETLPELNPEDVDPRKSMKDLGANSLDRADVILQSMETLELKFPLHELAGVENIQGLVDFLHARVKA